MKRVLLVLTIMLFVLTLSSCMSEEDYYTRTEIDQIVVNAVETETAALVTRIDELNQLLEEAQPTQAGRFFFLLVEKSLLDNGMQFVTLDGNEISGEVDAWAYGYIIIELDRYATVELEASIVAPDGNWNLNLYLDQIYEPSTTFEEIQQGVVYTLELAPGFNIIEIDSYYDFPHEYSFFMNEIL